MSDSTSDTSSPVSPPEGEQARFAVLGWNLGSIEEACEELERLSAMARAEGAQRISLQTEQSRLTDLEAQVARLTEELKEANDDLSEWEAREVACCEGPFEETIKSLSRQLDNVISELASERSARERAERELRWLVEYIREGYPELATPDHECGYVTSSDSGNCAFHRRWWDLLNTLGLVAELAAEAVPPEQTEPQ